MIERTIEAIRSELNRRDLDAPRRSQLLIRLARFEAQNS